jgi:hypothetical protein
MLDYGKADPARFWREQIARVDNRPILFSDENTVQQDMDLGGIWRMRNELV